jgi:hypothetical protein
MGLAVGQMTVAASKDSISRDALGRETFLIGDLSRAEFVEVRLTRANRLPPKRQTISQFVKSVVKKFLFFFLPFNLLPE